MAEGKNIEIRIAATGGDQAAAEIKKVEQASQDAAQATQGPRGFGGMLDALDAKKMRDDAAEAAKELKKLAEAQKEVAKTLPALSESDFAAEAMSKLGGATASVAKATVPAIGGLAGMGESLLSLAGGPLVIATAVIGGVLGYLKKWQAEIAALEDRQRSVSDAFDEATQKTLELARASQLEAGIEESSKQRAKEHEEALRQLTSAKSADIEVSRERGKLLKEEQQAENEIAKAKADTDIAAEKDPVKKEEIRQRARKEQQDRELRQIEDEKNARKDTLDRLEQNQTTVGVEGANQEGDLRGKAASAKQDAEDQRKLETLAKARAAALKKIYEDESVPFDERRSAARESGVSRRAGEAAGDEAKRLEAEAADYTKQANEIAKTTKDTVDGIVTEMNRLYQEIQKLDRDKGTKTAVFAERDKLGDITVNKTREEEAKKAAEKKKREDDKAAREAEKEEKKRLEAELETGEKGLDASARERGLQARKRGLGQSRGVGAGNDTVAAVGKALQDGTDPAELQKLGDMVREAQSKNGALVTSLLLQIITGLQEQDRQVEILRQQLKNKK
jgi:hypothetical protein